MFLITMITLFLVSVLATNDINSSVELIFHPRTSNIDVSDVSVNNSNMALNYIPEHIHSPVSHKFEDMTVADAFSHVERILCLVMTRPNHTMRAAHIRATWGKRCNILLLMRSDDPSTSEGTNHSVAGDQAALEYIHRHYINRVDWFVKADDETFVCMENLRLMVLNYDHNTPLYTGISRSTPGAGYVISRAALDIIVTEGIPFEESCTLSKDVTFEDCLKAVRVKFIDSQDHFDKERFIPLSPFNEDIQWLPSHQNWSYLYSGHAISFHHMLPKELYVMDFLMYHLRPYGVDYRHAPSDTFEKRPEAYT